MNQIEQPLLKGFLKSSFLAATFLACAFIVTNSLANDIIHDAEYDILEAQHGEKWAADDKNVEAKLA